MYTLVLLRHGRSDWNDKNLFTGWVDSDLNAAGEEEARAAGRVLAEADVLPEVAHTSVLKRAIRTCNLTRRVRPGVDPGASALAAERAPLRRPPGAGQGRDAAPAWREQFMAWRRSYDVPPPPLEPGSQWDVSDDPRYADLPPEVLPRTECLKDVVERMLPYWVDGIVPDLRAGKVVLVAAHGNSLRALVKHLEGISDADIAGLNIATGVPWVYDLGEALYPASDRRQLGDPEAIRKATEAVARQGAPAPDAEEPVNITR